MPTYNLKCTKCGATSHINCKIEDRGKQKCPTKGCNELLQVTPSPSRFWLKGRGWYKDGYS